MSVATLLTVLQILGGMGTLAKDIVDIRTELEGKPPQADVPAEMLKAVKAAMGNGGSVWADEDTAQGFIEHTLAR